MRELYWFQNDLRLSDNPGLMAHAGAQSLLLVYLWPEKPAWCNLTGMGKQRERFLLESLQALRARLQDLGQDLLVLSGNPVQLIPQLVDTFGIERVGTTVGNGTYEQAQSKSLATAITVPLNRYPPVTLLEESALPWALCDVPRQFTPFRKQVEKMMVSAPLAPPMKLPGAPASAIFGELREPDVSPHPSVPLRGGSEAGLKRLGGWMFEREAVVTYKETRSHLGDLDGSSLLSPWLANGCLSVREVAHHLFDFEQRVQRNDSTAWLYQELLWREFFHWRARVDGHRLFRADGIAGKKKLRTFEARDFARWCQGDTNYPLVNALLHQLVATGWMSNRGRQIVASCLVNELGHDWRYGAAFFEQQLIDYDVASNYGNWQYIAGVGTDPRGGRHFNLEKQADQYDPQGLFTAAWDGFRPMQPQYVNDAADWPLDA